LERTTQADALPHVPGTYILLLRVDSPCTVVVGRLGTAALAPGWVLYVGSAFGPGGLAARLRHHLRPASKPHWHIDYVRAALDLCEIWVCAAPQRLEHRFAALLHSARGSSIPLPRCGASDCRCPAHLFHFAARPVPHLLAAECPVGLQVFTCAATSQA
jgi:Uri superfamily endonuclease